MWTDRDSGELRTKLQSTCLVGHVRAGSVVLTADPLGTIRVLDMLRLRLPANLRRRCGVNGGMGLLLAGDPQASELVVIPPGVLDKLSQLHDRVEEST